MNFNFCSELLKALAHPVRLKIVKGLIDDENMGCNVGDIVKKLDLPQSSVSQQLSILKRSGIIEPKKKGTITCYWVCNLKVREIITILNND